MNIFNKSLVTNVVAALVAVLGIVMKEPHCQAIGYYALSGAITNWLAVYMLFERIPFLYGSGVIPKHFESFKIAIKNLIMDEFFTLENISKLFSAAQDHVVLNAEAVTNSIDFDKLYDDLTAVILASSFGNMLNMVGGAEALIPLKEPVIEKLKQRVASIIASPDFAQALNQSTGEDASSQQMYHQVEAILMVRLDELTPTMVKDIIQTMIRRHLGWLVVWGGVLGGAIGLAVSLVG